MDIVLISNRFEDSYVDGNLAFQFYYVIKTLSWVRYGNSWKQDCRINTGLDEEWDGRISQMMKTVYCENHSSYQALIFKTKSKLLEWTLETPIICRNLTWCSMKLTRKYVRQLNYFYRLIRLPESNRESTFKRGIITCDISFHPNQLISESTLEYSHPTPLFKFSS